MGNRPTKRCINCRKFLELAIAGPKPKVWHAYCDQGDMLHPCSGGECEYPYYYERKN